MYCKHVCTVLFTSMAAIICRLVGGRLYNTVNSLMFAGINVCVFETKPCSRGIIFAVSSGLVNYLGIHELCLRVFIFAI